MTIREAIKAWAVKRPRAGAIEAPGAEPVTYAQLWQQMNYIADKLRAAGLTKKDRVALVVSRGSDGAILHWGISACAAAVPLNPEYSGKEFIYYFKEFKIKAIAVDKNTDRRIIDLAREHDLAVIKTGKPQKEKGLVFNLEIEARNDKNADQRDFPKENDAAFILHTSGTTSRPKIVPLSQANVYAGAQNIIKALKLSAHDRCLNVMPLFHVHGLMVTMAVLCAGGRVISTPKFDRHEFFHWLDKSRPTWYSASAALQQAILSRADEYRDIINKQNLRFIRSSSAPLPPEATVRLEKIFRAPVAESYGMTEAALQITSQPLPPMTRKLGSVGKPAGPELKIIDKRGQLLRANELGEIIIKGPSVINAYENNQEANQDCFWRGWLKTGDLGYIDRDGFVFVRGRIKEIINKGGENISPREIDEAILRYPGIEQAITFSRPHKELGEDIAAAVITRKGAEFSEQDIKKFLHNEIAGFKIPTRIIRVDELPKTGAGKLKRIGVYNELKQYFKKSYMRPKKDLEKQLIKVWADVLNMDESEIGVEDNFFEIGGDSLKAAEVVKKMEKAEYKIKADDLLNYPTVRGLADISG